MKQPQLVLGTAQLGGRYGITNTVGELPEGDAVAFVRAALDAGIRCIDTARGYGEAERRVGTALQQAASDVIVVTKLDPLAHLAPDAAMQSLAASRSALRRPHLDVLLLHRAAHRTQRNGAIWLHLKMERERGRIGRIGVSVQSPAEAVDALADRDVQHLQLPFNLLDDRWDAFAAAARHRPDVTIHVRSIFLQGLLANPGTPWPNIEVAVARDVQAGLAKLVADLGRDDVADLCGAFVRAQDWIDGVVIGMETNEQLARNLAAFNKPPLSAAEARQARSALPRLPEALLDPARWPA